MRWSIFGKFNKTFYFSAYSTENSKFTFFQNCKGKGKRVLTQIELRQYGIEVSEPVCKPKNGKRKFTVPYEPIYVPIIQRVTGSGEAAFGADGVVSRGEI